MSEEKLTTTANDFGLSDQELKVYLMLQGKINSSFGDNNKELFRQLLEVKNEVQKISNTTQLEIEGIRNNVTKTTLELDQKITDVQEKNNYAQKGLGSKYVGLGALGAVHIPAIPSKTMGVFLQKLGIAKKTDGITIPLAQFQYGQKNPLSKQNKNLNHDHWQWHIDKTWTKIKSILEKSNKLHEFETCETVTKITEFVKSL